MDSTRSLNETFKNTHLREDDDTDRLIIGLDFGTTYSGIAYAFTTQPDKVYTINEWPGATGRKSPKCPTLIKYDGPNSFKWGFELDRTTKERIEGIKLLLDPDQPNPLYVPAINTEAELNRLGKPALTIASDFISAIFQHALSKIKTKYPESYLDLLEKQYVLSVPAVWSDKAKDATLRAAENAGISPVKLIKEPEAAALFTLNEMKNKGLEVGDALVLCDAGGGTVDLISYEIKSLNPFDLGELTAPTGGLAGSLMLNKRFEEWVKTVVGERAYLDLKNKDSYRLAMRTFDENIKPGFRSKDDEEQYVTFPKAKLKDDPSKGLQSDTITVTGRTLHRIFEPVFMDINKLVNEQVTQVRLRRMKEKHPKGYDIKAVFLVGGFGSSVSLCQEITSSHPDIQVIQPNDAWSAIVRGAVLSRLPSEARVVTSVATKHYGVAAMGKYDSFEDQGEEKSYDAFSGIWRVKKMVWYIKKGDDLQRSRKIEFPFYRSFDHYPSEADLRVERDLLESLSDKAPNHPKAGIVTKNCTVKSNLAGLPQEFIKKRSRNEYGRTITQWEVHYKIMVAIESGPMVFSLGVGGKEYGKVDPEY